MINIRPGALMFNTKAIRNHVDRATRKVLSRFGAFVRQTAKRSIRKRKKTSPPGQSPSSHTGLLRRFIWFAYEPGTRSVVIGPAQLTKNGRGEAPSLLEYGGSTTLKHKGKRKHARVRPHPFMGPAFEKEQKQLPALWRDSIR